MSTFDPHHTTAAHTKESTANANASVGKLEPASAQMVTPRRMPLTAHMRTARVFSRTAMISRIESSLHAGPNA